MQVVVHIGLVGISQITCSASRERRNLGNFGFEMVAVTPQKV
jgi:hypothetical protein